MIIGFLPLQQREKTGDFALKNGEKQRKIRGVLHRGLHVCGS
jgi:hypothetical protein